MRRVSLIAFVSTAVFSVAAHCACAEEKTGKVPAKLPPPATGKVDFVRDVAPILADRCYHCHGPDEHEGQLRLDAKAIVMRGGQSGPLLVAGNSAESLLVKRIAGLGDDEQMPPGEEPLTDEQIGIIRNWIDQGAPWPETFGAQVQQIQRHWAYVPPQKAPLPEVQDPAWCRNPVDYFTLAKMEQAGLAPSPEADPAKLVRRLSLDLTGLPPSVDEVDRFLADPSDEAYKELVERLLASPAYGERWARQWLDLVRYADSNGFQADQYRELWPYRDWVIDAMNDDMPYDQFTIEQIAGDLLPGATLSQKIATGMHRSTTCNVEAGVDPEENRVNQIIDRVNVTGTIWLGTTIECTQCHNHKYDPFTQRDFYRFFAFFNNTPLEVKLNRGVQFNFYGPSIELPISAAQEKQQKQLQAQREELGAQQKQLEAQAAERQAQWQRRVDRGLADTRQWHVLSPSEFISAGGATHEVLEDDSILVGGENADTDLYTVVVTTQLAGINGFRIDALTHEKLPGQGPGRQNPQRPNFVLNELTVTAQPAGTNAEPTPVKLVGASADYEPQRYEAELAVDGDPNTGWAIHAEFRKPHHLTLRTAEPIGFGQGTILTFTLDQQHGGGRNLGRFRISAMTGDAGPAGLPEKVLAILSKPEKKRDKQERQRLKDFFLQQDPAAAALKEKRAAVEKQLKQIRPPTSLVMVEMDKPRPTHVFKRGSFLDKGDPVEPGTPAILHPWQDEAPANRLGLARWLVDRNNPLAARVAVNRWWAAIFGQGIVTTPEDFGSQGDRPTHPKLLDWLAVDFMDSGWSMKHVHRQMVTSSTYRQSSRITPPLAEGDPDNKLLARAPRFRLPAETIRDVALKISGKLTSEVGGPPVYPPQPPNIWRHVGRNAPVYKTSTDEDRFRRGLYVIWRRSAPYPSFTNFDAPDRAACTVQRPRTNTPLQALTLLNDQAYVELAQALAARIVADRPEASVAERIEYAFRLCASRRPSADEINQLAEVYRRELAQFEKDPASARPLAGEADAESAPRMAAWFVVANILMNLDETITKG